MLKVISILKRHRMQVLVLFVIGAVASVASNLGLPLVIKQMIDEGMIKGDLGALISLSLVGAAIVVFGSGVDFATKLMQVKLQNAIVLRINAEVLEGFYRLPYNQTLKNGPGYYISRIYDETARVVAPLVSMAVSLTIVLLSIAVSFSFLVYLSWRLAILLSLSIPVLYVITNRATPRIRDTSKRTAEDEAKTKAVLERLVGAQPIVNAFGLHEEAKLSYSESLKQVLSSLYANVKISMAFSSVSTGLAFATQLFLLVVSGYEIIQGRLTLGGALAISNVYGVLSNSVGSLLRSIPSLQQAIATYERVREFSDLSATPAERRQVERIELDKVSFAYDEQEVLSGLSLRLDPGETVLLSGRNGSGKTTLAQVVAGLLQPTAGAASVHSLDYISLAPFPPVFIPGDVRTNVGYDKLPPKSQEVVLTLAQEFELEEKLDVDPNELSAGQKQKVSIIRALSKDASLYIFDEPLANIDVQTRQLVLRRILELTRGKTVVIVMHSEGEFNHFFDRVINLSPASAATAETALA